MGPGWRKYLGLDELRKELAAGPTAAKPAVQDGADAGADAAADAAAPADDAADARLATLWKIHSRFVADAPGLELPQFLAAGNALEDYIELAEVTEAAEAAPGDGTEKQPTLQEQYTTKLTELAKRLEEYQSKPSEELAANIDQRLGWLWRRHLDRDLVNLVRRCYGRPNLYVAIQKGLISTGVDRPIDERDAPLNDNILGTSISGRATTVGQVKVELVPIANQAMIRRRCSTARFRPTRSARTARQRFVLRNDANRRPQADQCRRPGRAHRAGHRGGRYPYADQRRAR